MANKSTESTQRRGSRANNLARSYRKEQYLPRGVDPGWKGSWRCGGCQAEAWAWWRPLGSDSASDCPPASGSLFQSSASRMIASKPSNSSAGAAPFLWLGESRASDLWRGPPESAASSARYLVYGEERRWRCMHTGDRSLCTGLYIEASCSWYCKKGFLLDWECKNGQLCIANVSWHSRGNTHCCSIIGEKIVISTATLPKNHCLRTRASQTWLQSCRESESRLDMCMQWSLDRVKGLVTIDETRLSRLLSLWASAAWLCHYVCVSSFWHILAG